MSKDLVVIPTYNEKDNIEKIIHAVMALPSGFNLLVVEDNSPDGTAQLVRNLMQQYEGRLFMEERKGKLGLGTAYLHGFKWGLERDYALIYEMDADFSHNPADLERLREACMNGADLAIGSRYIKGVNVVNWPMGRVLMSYYASAYVRMITRMKVRDTTAGFKCYTRKVLKAIDFKQIRFTGYAFQIEMKYTAWKLGFKIVEVPIIFTERTLGESKMNKKIFKEAIFGVISLRIRSIQGVYRRMKKKALSGMEG
ncbi:MAG TPA: polyprenol monophosphomannose synthase [Bacteroidales bacterium]|nr:polyprenol monophosphomannose synthase [Bacteroidales bacterium]HRZ49681.1 polyprenol monophosphomannose synthase [Bacteroidales bacterium]